MGLDDYVANINIEIEKDMQIGSNPVPSIMQNCNVCGSKNPGCGGSRVGGRRRSAQALALPPKSFDL